MKIAFVSPLPPSEYGVPVYSAKTVEALAKHGSVDVVARKLPPLDTLRAINRVIDGKSPVSLDNYDIAFFVYGNHEHHIDAARFGLLTEAGIGIFHDAQQLDFARSILSNIEMVRIAESHLGCDVSSDDLQQWVRERHLLPFPFLNPISDFCRTGIVHSPLQAKAFASHYPGMDTHYAPVAIQHRFQAQMLSPEYSLRAKLRCKVHEGAISIGTFGFVHGDKLPAVYMSAVRHMHDWGIPVHFWFVGSVTAEYREEMLQLIDELSLADFVHFSGRLSESEYCDFLAAMDLAIQLRRPYFGQLSGALLDCVAAGLPTISTHSLANSIEAPGMVQRIKDHFSSIDVAEACLPIIHNLRAAMRYTEEWDTYCEEHSFERYARRLIDVATGA